MIESTGIITFLGVDESISPGRMPKGMSYDALNCDLHPAGSIRKRAGIANWEEPDVGEPVTGLGVFYEPDDDKWWMLAGVPGKIWATQFNHGSDPTWPSSANTSGGADDFWDFESGWYINAASTDYGTSMFACNGVDEPLVFTGTGLSIVEMHRGIYGTIHGIPGGAYTGGDEWRDWHADPPAGFHMRAESTKMRMYAWGFPGDPTRIDYSELGAPYNWLRSDYATWPAPVDAPETDGGYWHAIRHDNDPVVAVIGHYDLLVVLKRYKTLIYRGDHGVDFQVIQELPVGCVSQYSIQSIGRDLVWWSDGGPVSLRGIEQYGDLAFNKFGTVLQDTAADMQAGSMKKIRSYHDIERHRVLWWIPQSTGTEPSKAVCWYYDEPRRWIPWEGEIANFRCVVRGLDHEGTTYIPYGGMYDGRIVRGLVGVQEYDYSGDDVAIESHYATHWDDLGDPNRRKRGERLRLVGGVHGVEKMNAYAAWDYESDFSQLTEKRAHLGGSNSVYGKGVYAAEETMELNTTLSGAAETAVVVTAAIPSAMPATGQINVELDNGKYLRIHYTSWAGSTFTIPATDFSTTNATSGNEVKGYHSGARYDDAGPSVRSWALNETGFTLRIKLEDEWLSVFQADGYWIEFEPVGRR